MIGAVDHRHAHFFAGELFGCFQSAKAGTDNDDVGLLCRRVCHVLVVEAAVLSGKADNVCLQERQLQPTTEKNLSWRNGELSCAPYAQANRAQ